MRHPVLFPCLLLLTFSIACKNADVAPKSTPAPAAETAMDPPSPPETMDETAMTPPTTHEAMDATAMDPPKDPPLLVLPMINRACSTHADCTVTSNPKIEDGVCCIGCPSFPAARSWVVQVVRLCDNYNTRNQVSGCPKVKCSDIPDVVCRSGECQFQK